MENLGSLLQLARTNWVQTQSIFSPGSLEDPEPFDMSEFDDWEHQILKDLLNIDTFANFHDFTTLFASFPTNLVTILVI